MSLNIPSDTPELRAKIHLSDNTLLNCVIGNISNTEILVTSIEELPQTINKGDIAELLVITQSNNTLKIRVSLGDTWTSGSTNTSNLQLTYIGTDNHAIKKLVSWFQQSNIIDNGRLNINLNNINQMVLDQFSHLLEVYFDVFDSHLLKLAETATNNDQQNKLFEVKAQLQQHQRSISQYSTNHLSLILNQCTPPQDNISTTKELGHKDLSLISLNEFEYQLSIETITRRAKKKYYISLICLEKRYSQILNRPISQRSLPVAVENFCQSFQKSIEHHSIGSELTSEIYKVFDQQVICKLDLIYDNINSQFKSLGILPNIESKIGNEKSKLVKNALPPSSQLDTNTPQSSNILNQPKSNDPEIFSTVKEILDLLHSSTDQTKHETSLLSPEKTSNNLDILASNDSYLEDLLEGASLSEKLQQISGHPMRDDTANLVTVADNLFNSINDNINIPKSLTKIIHQLKIPIAKSILTDSDFFLQNDYPAKTLINIIIRLCQNSDMPNQALEKTLDKVIHDINSCPEITPDTFSGAIEKLKPISQQQQHAYNRNTNRIIQTYDGKQQVQQAKNAVEKEISRRVSPPEAPDILVDLIENGWRELLKITYIKTGEDSEEWKENLAAIDQLLNWIIENDSNDSYATMEKELEADSFADYIGQKLNNIFPGDYRYHSTVENIRDSLKGQRDIKMIPLSCENNVDRGKKSELSHQLESANPHLTRWLKRAKNLKPGDEFSYLDDDTGDRNIKLVWVSDNQQHFVFVNRRGQKILDYDLVDIANELSNGLSPVKQESELPLVERSLYSTVEDAYKELSFKSTHDDLTGLISRKESELLLNNSLIDAKNNWHKHSLLYIDIDNFSLTNDLHGHVAGDQLLIDIGEFLSSNTPENTHIARMAGNEFTVLLQSHDLENSKKIAETLRRGIDSNIFQWEESEISLTASIGLIGIDKYTANVVDLIRNAVQACKKAKANGGNKVYNFKHDAKLHSRREKLLSWIDKLDQILDSDKIILRAQEIAPLMEKEEGSHFEILMAIKDKDGGLTSPIEFIEAAECYNRMQRVDQWVIEKTFQWLNSFKIDGKNIPHVSINLSGNSINDENLMNFIFSQFAQYKVPTQNICFEVTETSTINNLAEAADFIREMKKIGCKFSLDDFGSGNASYQYLKHLPVDYLKIDGMFISDIDTSNDDYALVKSIHEIAHLMGKKTIAEFVENEAIIEKLKIIGVDFVQGYAIHKPTILSDIIIS